MSRYDRFMTRIVILGCAGSGKSRLAARLGERLSTPIVSLDALWRPFSAHCDVQGFRQAVGQAHAGSSWIGDGNFADVTFDIRLPRAQLIVWVEQKRILCGLRSVKRVFGNPAHRFRDLVTVFAAIESYHRRSRPVIELMRQTHGLHVPVVHLDADKGCDEFLERFAPSAPQQPVQRSRRMPLSAA
jgi:adenylate kinase family enzyme